MFPTTSRHRPTRRRGSILLVVITLLALFAAIGLLFALSASNQATINRMNREAEANAGDKTDVESALNPPDYADRALMYMIYGSRDNDPQGVQSGLRGYEFGRTMYGQPHDPTTFNPIVLLNPYTGQGLFAPTDSLPPLALPGVGPYDRTQVINYAYLPGSNYIIDPEYSWFRTDPTAVAPAPGNPDSRGNWYKNVAAPYTYPDLKDLYLAVIDTQTGQVLQPSYFRNYAFNTGTANPDARLAPPTVAPTNTDWLTPAGRLKIIRPRPIDHVYDSGDGRGPVSDFPYPPPNADGSYTGDVINYPGSNNNQRNDSLWVYPAGPVRMFKGKRYTALIAPMVIDLGGRVNLGMAGNRKGPAGAHVSSQGVVPSEVNPRWVFDPNAASYTALTPASQTAVQNLLSGAVFQTASGNANVTGRYGTTIGTAVPPPDRLSGQSQIAFNNGFFPKHYAGADVDAVGAGAADRAIPAGGNAALPSSPWPVFPTTRYPNDPATLTAELSNHPAQYNPDHHNRVLETFGPFLPIDQRVLGSRYAGLLEQYTRTDVARLAPKQLISGNTWTTPVFDPYATPPNPPVTTTDPAEVIRTLVTTFNANLNRPELVVRTGPAVSGVYPTARLGPIDVNRPLPDYRADPTKMLGPDNMANWANAQLARQRLARDIFVRLAALSEMPGVPGTPLIDGDNVAYVNTPPTNPADYTDPNNDYGYLRLKPSLYTAVPPTVVNALRDLAQVAVNMVDYLDPDDVSTTFVWNPRNPTAGTAQLGYILNNTTGMPSIAGGAAPTPVAATATTPGQMLPTDLGKHVVYGTEAPRLALNEVYATLTNNAQDYNPAKGINPGTPPATVQPFERRFWIELFNPMRADPALSENGLARLSYPAGVFGLTAAYSPYSIAITNFVLDGLNNPENVTGSPKHPTATAAGMSLQAIVDQFNYDATDFPEDPSQATPINEAATYTPYPPAVPSAPNTNIQRYVVQPHSGAGAGLNATNQNGFCVLGPVQNFPGQDTAGNPGDPAATIRIQPLPGSAIDPSVRNALQVPLTGAGNTDADRTSNSGASGQVDVILRRLANPYLPPNDPVEANAGRPYDPTLPPNPYVAVDRQEKVTVYDNVHFVQGNPTPLTPATTTQASLGRPHPVAASLAANQTTPVTNSPMSTFFKHNDNSPVVATPPAPFRWFVHLDRNVVNPVELAHVSAVRPDRVSEKFGQAGPPVKYYQHSIESLLLPGVPGGYPVGTPPGPGYLRRALEFLAARSPQSGVPVGGRQQGLVNVNTVWHPAVLRALFDTNPANFFRDADVSGQPDRSAWERMTQSGGALANSGLRSQAWPNVTPTDTPFWGKGELVMRGYNPAAMAPNGKPLFYNQNPTDDTTLYPSDTTPVWPTPELRSAVGDHTAVIAEPLKKVWNNAATTSDAFLVIMTVAFFEVRNDPATTPGGRVYLGKELYDQVPGDRRYRFFAIVDRTQLALDPSSLTPPVTQVKQAPSTPWQTVLAEDVVPGQTFIKVAAATNNPTNDPAVPTNAFAYADGTQVSLLGQALRLGFGDAGINGEDGEAVVTAPLPPPAPVPIPQVVNWSNGVATIALATPATRNHAAGTPVTNYLLGNPGPQTSFDPNDPRYKAVVPYFARAIGSQ